MDKLNSSSSDEASAKLRRRIDFKNGVPEILYRRAGLRCSVPRCKNPTTGPFVEDEGAVNMGTACHIYSAAEGGPRGRGGMSDDFISSAENGIWCCQYHGGLIDKGRGRDYSADTLFAWKKLAEARTRKQMNDIPSPLGWVESIAFHRFLKRPNLPKMALSRRTLMFGENGSGKTVLLEAAASISQSKYSERMASSSAATDADPGLNDFEAKVIYSTVDSFSKELTLQVKEGNLVRLDGGVQCLLPPGDIEVVYCSENDLSRKEGEDDLDLFLRLLNVDKSALLSLVRSGTSTVMPGRTEFRPAYTENDFGEKILRYKNDGEQYFELMFKKESWDFFIPFTKLSGSEQGRVVVELLVVKAREVCKQRLTLLLVEGMIWTLDIGNFETLLMKLSDEEFQVVVSLPPWLAKEVVTLNDGTWEIQEKYWLTGWSLAEIDALDSSERKSRRLQQEIILCPICKGINKSGCDACGGKGTITRKYAASIDLSDYDNVDCPLCSGKGSYKQGRCPECDGAKTMLRKFAKRVDTFMYKMIDCPICKGDGVFNGGRCFGCEGERMIERGKASQLKGT